MAKEQPIDERLDELREDDGQIYVERDKVDFDPSDGLLSGTAIDGTSEITDDPDEVAAAENSDKDESGDDSGDDSGEVAAAENSDKNESGDGSGDDADTPDE